MKQYVCSESNVIDFWEFHVWLEGESMTRCTWYFLCIMLLHVCSLFQLPPYQMPVFHWGWNHRTINWNWCPFDLVSHLLLYIRDRVWWGQGYIFGSRDVRNELVQRYIQMKVNGWTGNRTQEPCITSQVLYHWAIPADVFGPFSMNYHTSLLQIS